MVDDYKRKSASPGDRPQYEHAMIDPVLKHAQAQLPPRRAISAKRGAGQARREGNGGGHDSGKKRNIVKSIGLLQAYGEFERFMHMSKQHLKQQRKEMRLQRQADKRQVATDIKNNEHI